MCASLRGFSSPLSPEGRAQIVGPFPWHYSAALMGINYKADPAEIRKLLPEPYQLSAIEPDGVSCWFLDWLSVGEADKEMICVNPERAQYQECFLSIRCRINGVEGLRCPYIWVDKDNAVLRGWFYGYPKKLGRIHLSFNKPHLYELNPGLGKVGPGTRFTAFCEAHGERLITGTIQLTRQITPAELPLPFGLNWFNIVHFPSTDIDTRKPLVHQIVTNVVESVRFGEAWAAEPESLVFTSSALEEHTSLKPLEQTGAYYVTMGQTFKGTKIVHQY